MRFAVLLLTAVCLSAQSPRDIAQDRLLQWMDHIAQSELDSRAAEIAKVRTPADAERRKEAVRAKILEALGGLPDYNGPLNAHTTGELRHETYTIEKVVFESLPKVYVTANLYRPNGAGPHAGILMPLGHWEQGKPGPQLLAANLAAKGFVVLAYDPYGQGERLQIYDRRLGNSIAGGATTQHFLAGAQSILIGQSFARYRIFDAKRALDYLLSRPEVDRNRIGCTGCSGGGTLTTYISALDPRIKVAAPACYMNSFRSLFTGAVGDSEQSLPNFLALGLDQADYVELFAPKPWLVSSTLEDFFKIEGAREIVEEAKHWYRIYGAEDRFAWAIGHGEHGTPREIRESIYAWMIRWLQDGKGSPDEQPVTLHPDHELQVTRSGQVATEYHSREMDDVLRDEYARLKRPGSVEELRAALGRWSPQQQGAVEFRVSDEKREPDILTQSGVFETEPGLDLSATLLVPRSAGTKPGVVVVETEMSPSPTARALAQQGAVVLSLLPRGKPAPDDDYRVFVGDWLANTRAWLIGRNLASLRAYDIRRGVDLLAARGDVDKNRIKVAARGVSGTWALIAAALDDRIKGAWLDRTPYRLSQAFENPLHRNLNDAVIPGFLLHWDTADLMKAIAPRPVLWSDPTDWMGTVVPVKGDYRYLPSADRDVQPFIDALVK